MSQFTCRPAGCSWRLITSIQSGSCGLTAGLSAIYMNFIFIWAILRIQRLTALKDKMKLMTCFTIFPLFFMFNFKVVSLWDVTPPCQTSVPCFILMHVHVNIPIMHCIPQRPPLWIYVSIKKEEWTHTVSILQQHNNKLLVKAHSHSADIDLAWVKL